MNTPMPCRLATVLRSALCAGLMALLPTCSNVLTRADVGALSSGWGGATSVLVDWAQDVLDYTFSGVVKVGAHSADLPQRSSPPCHLLA